MPPCSSASTTPSGSASTAPPWIGGTPGCGAGRSPMTPDEHYVLTGHRRMIVTPRTDWILSYALTHPRPPEDPDEDVRIPDDLVSCLVCGAPCGGPRLTEPPHAFVNRQLWERAVRRAYQDTLNAL